MLRSMFSGVSGLRAHQTKMDVIGNNIANVNTVGFKSSRVTFQEIYNQTLKAASAPSADRGRGGSNPHQVGLGVTVASIDVLHTRGGAQRTDKATDLAIEGDGFFVVSDGVSSFYTRAGNFDVDEQGYLVSASGLKVQGWTGRDSSGSIPAAGATREINLANLSMPPRATSRIKFEGNLNSQLIYSPIPSQNGRVEYTTSIYDSLGEEHNIVLKFEKTGDSRTVITSKEIMDFTGLEDKKLKLNDIEITLKDYANIDEMIADFKEDKFKDSKWEFENIGNSLQIKYHGDNLRISGDAAEFLGLPYGQKAVVTIEKDTNGNEVLDFTEPDPVTGGPGVGEKVIIINGREIVLKQKFDNKGDLITYINNQLEDLSPKVELDEEAGVLAFFAEGGLTIEDNDDVFSAGMIVEAIERTVPATEGEPIPNKWKVTVLPASTNTKIESPEVLYSGMIEFDGQGKIMNNSLSLNLESIRFNNGANDTGRITIEFDPEKMTQNASESTFKVGESDGHGSGTLSDITIDSMGRVIGIYSNGQAREDAVVAVARFSNPAGLSKLGDNLFQISANSGRAITGQAGIDGRGVINPGALEMSNVDLAKEFTDMIIAQRGFQANSRIITTSDELLQELVNLKR